MRDSLLKLKSFLEGFIGDHAGCGYERMRWIAAELQDPLRMVDEALSQNLSSEFALKEAAFLAEEVEQKIARKQEELSELERDLRKLRSRAKPPAENA